MKLRGKTCLVTGANSGIGKITAIELAKQKARVVMLCRNEEKAEKARQEIYKVSGNTDIHIILCDLSSQQQIHDAADEYRRRFTSLDILINNAGIIAGNERLETADGFELTFAVNHLAPFTLTLLLLDLLRHSEAGRIITVSSEAHRFARFDMEDLQLKHHPYSGLNAYCISKLCNIWFTRQLAALTSRSKLSVNCLHPGFVASNFGNSASAAFKALLILSQPFAISNEKGAATTLYLAGSEAPEHISGHYFKDKKIKKPSKAALNDAYAEELWEKSAALTRLELHKVSLS
ncbi:SDR family oxidoreductase [Nafulsella turpanensis]|uniref:SDR family oxidoreductase n=1 Tax=Nafulsella turpanensis TaxID=1265690 RepID=UPI00034913D0|nr:SDR family oxidoreductase [Nafulsella turpanensis]